MLKIYFTENENVYVKLEKYLSGLLPSPARILRNGNGKPYLEGDPLFFSISLCGTKAVIALSQFPVGVDLELYKNKMHTPITNRFSDREQCEILCEKDFLIHWTVREAYIKMLGGTLSENLKSTAYYGGNGIYYAKNCGYNGCDKRYRACVRKAVFIKRL